MNFTPEQQHFMRKYLEALRRGDAAIFAGAGLSVDSGLVDWKTLLAPIARELNLSIERERDLVALAQFYVNERLQNRHGLNRLILDYIGINAKPNRKHRSLAQLPIDTYWTINYDKLLEKALETRDKVVDVRHTLKQLNVTRTRRDAVLYKMHGDVDHPDEAVLVRDDYEAYHLKMGPFVTALVGDLLSKRFLFLGLSFEDPNLNFVLGRIRAQFGAGGGGEHFCLMRREHPKEGEDPDDYQFRQVRQGFLAKDLMRFNITTVFVDEYEHIDLLLEEIERRYRRRTVFISGSAATTEPWSPEDGEEFVTALSGALVEQGCQLVTGFGRGIGHDVVTGALTVMYRRKLNFDQHLLIRPFPHVTRESPEARAMQEQHRQEMIPLAGVALFLFGNRHEGKEIIDAPGVRREFEIALQHGLVPVPIGGTGGMSARLHAEVLGQWAQIFPQHSEQIRPHFEALNATQDKLLGYVQPVLEIIRILQGDH
jgi:hypothetical protein